MNLQRQRAWGSYGGDEDGNDQPILALIKELIQKQRLNSIINENTLENYTSIA